VQRRRVDRESTPKRWKTYPLSSIFALEGPLVREFSRAKVRGYQGPPSRWLKGPVATRRIGSLRQKGLLDPLWTGRLSVFDRRSPMHWTVNGCCITEQESPPTGFNGERLRRKGTDSVTIARQASAVKSLRKKEWPRESRGYCWPTFPTLFESWEMLMRGVSPRQYEPYDTRIVSDRKIPTRRILSGMKERTISLHVRGIRADVPVPGKFLRHFEYRWGFLILRRNRPLPGSLARWLADEWKSDITKMFLIYPMRFSEALRRMPDNKYYLLSGFVAGSTSTPRRDKNRPRWSYRGLRRLLSRPNTQTVNDCSAETTSNESGRGVRLS